MSGCPLAGVDGCQRSVRDGSYGGGWSYVAVATLAGLLFGLEYLMTGRLVWGVVCHWGVNLVHFALFAYPVSA